MDVNYDPKRVRSPLANRLSLAHGSPGATPQPQVHKILLLGGVKKNATNYATWYMLSKMSWMMSSKKYEQKGGTSILAVRNPGGRIYRKKERQHGKQAACLERSSSGPGVCLKSVLGVLMTIPKEPGV